MKDGTNLSYWNKVSKIYDGFMRKDSHAYQQMFQLISARLNRNMQVLELATGTGIIARNIAGKVAHVEATDFSGEMIKKAKSIKHRSNLHFSVQDACNLPYAEKSFDMVIISNALHIMPNPENALANIRRVLKDDGILIAPTFTYEQSKSAAIKVKLMALTGFKAYHNWNTKDYVRFLLKNGFVADKTVVLKASFPLSYIEAKKRE